MLKKEDRLIWLGYSILLVHNALVVPGLFKFPLIQEYLDFYNDNTGTLGLFEFVVLAGLFGNLIMNFDKYKNQSNKIHLILTGLFMFCFFLKIIFFFLGGFEDLKG